MNAEEHEVLINFRRHLHRNPELSCEEFETAKTIENALREIGLTPTRIAETGVVATIEGDQPGPTIGFRGDIDALPILEEPEHDYGSNNPGVMHACGHDVHTTLTLGLGRQLMKRRADLRGSVKLIFQPAEEASPIDEPIGAERMVQEGVLQNPAVDAVFAFHCMPTLDVGKIGFTGGAVWASSDLVEISITGKKTHAAYPHEGIDAALVAAQVLVALQSVTSRRVDTRQPCVLTIGHLEAGDTYNVLADSAKMTGILRTLSTDAYDVARKEIVQIVEGISQAMGATANVIFTPGARLTENDSALESSVTGFLTQQYGTNVVVKHPAQLGAEDFAAFSTRVPGCYLFLGVRNESRGITHMIHTPKFDVDEACLKIGVEAMTDVVLALPDLWTP